MNLKELISPLKYNAVEGGLSKEVNNINFDSRKIKDSDLFVAVKGVHVDGHEFIETAIQNGATVIVCEVMPLVRLSDLTYILVENSAYALSILASNFYGNPSRKLKLVGVTGTNGKTTTVTLLYKLYQSLAYKVGMLSTVVNKINDQSILATHTTGDAIQINQLLSKMVEEGVDYCFMEVSSHAIHQHRISALDFDGAVFTNISHDHLDYHKTFPEYIKAKKMFFDFLPKTAFALVNSDDKRGEIMLQNTKARKKTFALKRMGDFKTKIISNTLEGLELEIENRQVWFSLIGKFNAYNLLSAYAVGVLLGEGSEKLLKTLSNLKSASGRFDLIENNRDLTLIVDYAHTPDALENVLKTIQDIGNYNQVITVVGCGGGRDKTKRPTMASIAERFSDKVILTSDNPRFEEPMAIIEDMKTGITGRNSCELLEIENRQEAIEQAVKNAQKKDVILVAGKGHENYQDIQGVKHPFDDKKILANIFKIEI